MRERLHLRAAWRYHGKPKSIPVHRIPPVGRIWAQPLGRVLLVAGSRLTDFDYLAERYQLLISCVECSQKHAVQRPLIFGGPEALREKRASHSRSQSCTEKGVRQWEIRRVLHDLKGAAQAIPSRKPLGFFSKRLAHTSGAPAWRAARTVGTTKTAPM